MWNTVADLESEITSIDFKYEHRLESPAQIKKLKAFLNHNVLPYAIKGKSFEKLEEMENILTVRLRIRERYFDELCFIVSPNFLSL